MELSKIFKIWNTSWAHVGALQDFKIWNIFWARWSSPKYSTHLGPCWSSSRFNLNYNLGPVMELTKILISESYLGPSYRAYHDFNIFWAWLMGMELTKISISKTYFGPISETIFVLGPVMELTKNLISGTHFWPNKGSVQDLQYLKSSLGPKIRSLKFHVQLKIYRCIKWKWQNIKWKWQNIICNLCQRSM